MHTVYILKCSDNSYYVGYTTHLDKRLIEHSSGDASNYTKRRLPIKLVYSEQYTTVVQAKLRERQLKSWSKSKKDALISGDRNKLKLLAKKKSK